MKPAAVNTTPTKTNEWNRQCENEFADPLPENAKRKQFRYEHTVRDAHCTYWILIEQLPRVSATNWERGWFKTQDDWMNESHTHTFECWDLSELCSRQRSVDQLTNQRAGRFNDDGKRFSDTKKEEFNQIIKRNMRANTNNFQKRRSKTIKQVCWDEWKLIRLISSSLVEPNGEMRFEGENKNETSSEDHWRNNKLRILIFHICLFSLYNGTTSIISTLHLPMLCERIKSRLFWCSFIQNGATFAGKELHMTNQWEAK